METEKELERLEICTKLVEGIRYFETMLEHTKVSMQGVQGSFPDLMSRLNHRLEIYQGCRERLKKRYKKAVTELYS